MADPALENPTNPTAAPADEPSIGAPRPSAAGVWLVRLGWAFFFVLCLIGAAIGGWIGPYVLDDQKLDTIVLAVALDWRDFGEPEARERLQYELDHQRIGSQIGDGACAFDAENGERTVACAWGVDLAVPLASQKLPLRFASRATVTTDGDLR